ncbi:MAG: hypothetical protein ACHREM_13905, partial [Polyangiales bacterium]
RMLGVVGAIAGFVAGLTPYLALPWFARHAGAAWVWGDVTTLPAVLRHARRSDFGSTALSRWGGEMEPLRQLGAFARSLVAPSLLLLTLAAMAGVVAIARAARRGAIDRESPAPWLALLASFLLAGPVMLALFNLRPEGLTAPTVERFYLLPLLLLTPLVARGIDLARAPLSRQTLLAPTLACMLPAPALALSIEVAAAAHRPTLERYLANTLECAPPRAVVMDRTDLAVFGFLYAQHVRGLRPDVLHIHPSFLVFDWYRGRASKALGVEIPAGAVGHAPEIRDVAMAVFAAGRPLLVADETFVGKLAPLVTYPFGTGLIVVRDATELPSPDRLEAMNLSVFARFVFEPEEPPCSDVWSTTLTHSYARPFAALARAFDAAGRGQDATRNRARASSLSRCPSPF